MTSNPKMLPWRPITVSYNRQLNDDKHPMYVGYDLHRRRCTLAWGCRPAREEG